MARSEPIQTGRLMIVPFEETHISDRYLSWLNDAELMRFSRQRLMTHTVESCRIYRKSFEGTPNYFWAIEELKSGFGHIGNINAYIDSHNSIADIGIVIGEKTAAGGKYGTEAWIGVCDYLFKKQNIRKITAGTMALNKAMLGIMASSGMVDDGVRKKHFLYEGQAVDVVHKALFRDEWKFIPGRR